MLLRIIDISEQQETKDQVEVIFTAPDQTTIKFRSGYFPSFYTNNFSNLKSWYFEKYQLDSPKDDQNFVSKYIRLGQNMGDQLLGDDSEIYKIVKIIEENGYQNLSVTIESENFNFFKEQWETIVLPESKYILSSTVKGFFRSHLQKDNVSILSKIENYKEKIDDNVQLKVLNIVIGEKSKESFMNDGFVDSLLYNNLYDYESLYFENAKTFRIALEKIGFTADIIVFNGDIASDDAHEIVNEKCVAQTDVVELIKCTEAEFIIINSSFFSVDDEIFDRELGLAKLAMHIIEETNKAVLGFSNSSQYWVYSYCIKLVLEKLASGLSLGQSIIEVRKALQKKQEYDNLSITPIPFQPWSILQFYGINNSVFVSTPHSKVNIHDSDRFKIVRSKLHGFINEYLPINNFPPAENSFPSAITNAQKFKSLSIVAPQGYGKSQLAHDTTLFLIYKGFEKGFRFDFSKDSYTSSTMLEMIAQTIGQPSDDKDKIYEGLEKLKSIFVFENIDSTNITSINDLIEKLTDDNIYIFTMCKCQDLSLNLKPYILHLPELPTVNKLALGAQTFRIFLQDKIPDNIEENYQKFISSLSVPFLIKKLTPILLKINDEEIKEEAYEKFGKSEPNNCINDFYLWGFSKLSETARKLFIALKDVKGVYLEILNSTLFSGQEFQPAIQFFELLGNKDTDYSKCLEELEMFDFLTRHPYGRTINESSLIFLKENVALIDAPSDQKFSTSVSLIICESARRVIFHLNKNQNQAISFNLLANRGLLAAHMEKLWYAEEWDQFDKTLSSVEHFLKQNGIVDEIAKWAYHLLKKQRGNNSGLVKNSDLSASHLKLIIQALAAENYKDESVFSDSAQKCEDWLNSDRINQSEYLELNLYCLKFLEKYFLLEKNYTKLIKVSESMLDFFLEKKMDQFSISTIKMIIHCFTELRDFDQCEKYELLLLNSILKNEDIPAFVCQQVQLGIVSGRISRGNGDLALSLLNTIEETGINNPNLMAPISLLKADIAYLKNNFYEACKIYAVTLDKLYSQHQDVTQLEFIADKLRGIKKEIGEEEFNKVLNEQNVSSINSLIEPGYH